MTSADPAGIRGWQRIDARITTSGRLLDADLDRLRALGVVHVINLALDTHPEALAGEAAKLADRAIRYTHIPVPFDAPDEAHFSAFVRAIEADAAPLHVHCIANYRVSAFFYRYHRDHRGMAEPQARALMARQWQPDRSDRPECAPWAAFVAARHG